MLSGLWPRASLQLDGCKRCLRDGHQVYKPARLGPAMAIVMCFRLPACCVSSALVASAPR